MSADLEVVYQKLVEEARIEQDAFKRLLESVHYERKGILYSEMFFLWLCVHKDKPRRILESGRARGQSTLILARIFPESEIISIEHDKDSPDVQIAAERLREYRNIHQIFGDATTLLPEIVQSGSNDVVLIDGPKGFRGLRLAIRLLGSGHVGRVFVHDTAAGTDERKFLEKYLSDTLYSDTPILASQTHKLDTIDRIELTEEKEFSEGRPYGFSLACINALDEVSANRLSLISRWYQLISRIKNRIKL